MKERDIVVVLLLSIFTCGIYTLYWIYQTRAELKEYLRDDRINPALDLILCMICFPYFYYWIYVMSKDVVRAEIKAGVEPTADNSVLNLLLTFFGLAVVSVLILQGQLNAIVRAGNHGNAAA